MHFFEKPKISHTLQEAAKNGNPDAQFALGLRYDEGKKVAQNKILAARYYHMAAEQKHGPASFYLGLMYSEGEGVEKNAALAQQFFKQAEHWCKNVAAPDDERAIAMLAYFSENENDSGNIINQVRKTFLQESVIPTPLGIDNSNESSPLMGEEESSLCCCRLM